MAGAGAAGRRNGRGSKPPDLRSDSPGGAAGRRRELVAGVLLFSWYGIRPNGNPRGQFASVWPPADGRETWDGSLEWYDRQFGMIEDAGFDFVQMQIPGAYSDNVRRGLRALRRRRRAGSRLRAAPFFAWETWPRPLDFRTFDARAEFRTAVAAWARRFDRVLEGEGWQTFRGARLMGLWHVPGPGGPGRPNATIPAGFLEGVRDDVRQVVAGAELYISAHAEWSRAGVDQIDRLFNGMNGFARCSRPDGTPAPAADLLAGFWHAIDDPGYWCPRAGGETYRAAWREVERTPDIELVLVESWNEEHEGSGIRPADSRWLRHGPGDLEEIVGRAARMSPRSAMVVPVAGAEHVDSWGASPREYLDITAKALERLRGG